MDSFCVGQASAPARLSRKTTIQNPKTTIQNPKTTTQAGKRQLMGMNDIQAARASAPASPRETTLIITT